MRRTTPAILLPVLLAACSASDVTVSAEAPMTVHAGQRFVIVATISNYAGKAQELVSLDVGSDYIEGIAIEKTVPPYTESTKLPDGSMAYRYAIELPPNGKATVRMTARALKPGDYSDEIDFCVNSQVRFVSQILRTVVREKR